MSKDRAITIAVHEEEGSLWAEVLEMPGCFASGANSEELQLALEEAIGMYLSVESQPVTAEVRASGELTPVRRVPATLAVC
jgi:predicted RNase H-like HicB family nuclease